MTTGTVKWFDCKKGFGFIVNNDGKDVFVHFKSIEGEGFRSLKEKEIVSYEPAEGANGLYASKVVREAGKVPPAKARQAAPQAAVRLAV